MADRAAELSAGNLVTTDDRPSPWFAIHERATKGLVALALRLRLGPQSRASKAPKSEPAANLSYYDGMTLEGRDDDDDVKPG